MEPEDNQDDPNKVTPRQESNTGDQPDPNPDPAGVVNRDTKDGPPPPNKDRKGKGDPEDNKQDDQDDDKDTPGKSEELDTETWGDLEDEGANAVLLALQNAGATPDDASLLLKEAVVQGDPSKINKEALVKKVGKSTATLVIAGVENYISRNNEKIKELRELTAKEAGSEENWKKATEWARSNLPEGELDELTEMIGKGGKQTQFAARSILDAYNNDPNNSSLTNKAITPDRPSGPEGVEGISRREYGDKLEVLHRRGASEKEFQELHQRRLAGKKQGI